MHSTTTIATRLKMGSGKRSAGSPRSFVTMRTLNERCIGGFARAGVQRLGESMKHGNNASKVSCGSFPETRLRNGWILEESHTLEPKPR